MLDELIFHDMVDVSPGGIVGFPKNIELSSVSRFMKFLDDNEEKTFLLADALVVAKRMATSPGLETTTPAAVLRKLKDCGYSVRHVDSLDVKRTNLGGCFGFQRTK